MKEFLAHEKIAPLMKNRANVRPDGEEISVDIDTHSRMWKRALDKLFFELGPVTVSSRKPRGPSLQNEPLNHGEKKSSINDATKKGSISSGSNDGSNYLNLG